MADAKNSSPAALPAGRTDTIVREIAAAREACFGAWADPRLLAQWWGPEGFTNTFHRFALEAGAKWELTMHGPDGAAYPNEWLVLAVVPNERLELLHVHDTHRFRLVVDFEDAGPGRTKLTFVNVYDDAAEFARVREFIMPANRQMLTRLEAVLTAGRDIRVSRVFNAPRALVWRAWTDPKHLSQWWGPQGFTTSFETMEVRPGGMMKHVMVGPDGTRYPNKAIFLEVVEPELIRYKNAGGREDGSAGGHFVATWTFKDLGGGRTELTIHMVCETAEMRDRLEREFGAVEGAHQTLARLAEHLGRM